MLSKPIEPVAKRGQALPRISPFEQRIWPILAIGVSVSTIMSLTQFTVAFLFQDRLSLTTAETAQAVGLALVASGIAAFIAQMGLIRLFRLTPFVQMLLGLPLLLAMAVLLAVGESLPVLTLAMICQGLGAGLAMPGYRSAITYVVESHEQGAAAGLASSVGGMGFILGPMLGTGLYGLNATYPYLLAVAIMLIGMIVLLTRRPTGIVQTVS